jgi:FkbM family methyltransferase
MENRLSFRLADFLFKNAFPVYKLLYSSFKKKQDADEIAYLKKEIKSGDVVLDIGANIGFYATIISELVGKTGKVYCFEPDKINFKYLQNAVRSLQNITPINAAVSDKTGTLEIFTSHRLNVDHRTYKPEKYDSSYLVESVKIDDYLSKDRKVNFVKIDIQGAEFFAFKGMMETLSNNKGLQILTEFWPFALKSSGSSAEELLKFMNSLGYQAYLFSNAKLTDLNMSNLHLISDDEKNDSCNVVFKN